jgi:hypothetical protein
MNATERSVLAATQELERRVRANPHRKLKVIQDYYDELVGAGKTFEATVVLTFRCVGESGSMIPKWFPVAGFCTGGVTLAFFMVLVLLSMTGKEVPHASRFLIVIVLAIGMAMSSAFLGGSAAAEGKIPFFQDSPIKFSVGGAIAVFVIVLLLGSRLYI